MGRGTRWKGTAGDHKGPPSRSPPPSPLRTGEHISKRSTRASTPSCLLCSFEAYYIHSLLLLPAGNWELVCSLSRRISGASSLAHHCHSSHPDGICGLWKFTNEYRQSPDNKRKQPYFHRCYPHNRDAFKAANAHCLPGWHL